MDRVWDRTGKGYSGMLVSVLGYRKRVESAARWCDLGLTKPAFVQGGIEDGKDGAAVWRPRLVLQACH